MEITTTPRRSGRFGRYLVNLVCIATTLLTLAFIVPSAFGFQRYVITGGSMEGSIDAGSVVFAEVVPVSDLRVGDVITYMPPPDSGLDELVTHRIASIEGDVFVTKGDANASNDPWTFRLTQASQARVTHDVPYVGYAFLALADRETRMLLIGVPAGLIALMSLVQIAGALRRPAGATVRKSSVAQASKPKVTVGAE